MPGARISTRARRSIKPRRLRLRSTLQGGPQQPRLRALPKANPQALANQDMVVADLRALRDALELAKQQGIRWRLSVDI